MKGLIQLGVPKAFVKDNRIEMAEGSKEQGGIDKDSDGREVRGRSIAWLRQCRTYRTEQALSVSLMVGTHHSSGLSLQGRSRCHHDSLHLMPLKVSSNGEPSNPDAAYLRLPIDRVSHNRLAHDRNPKGQKTDLLSIIISRFKIAWAGWASSLLH